MKKYLFKRGEWERDFTYAYSLVAKSYTQFVQNEECVSNTFNEGINDYNYVSIAHKEKQKSGVTVSTTCSFDKFGAPLITLSNTLEKDGEGRYIYGEHYEVVLYEGGCNIWHIVKAPEGYAKKYVNTKCKAFEFPLADGEKIDMSVTVRDKSLKIVINGEKYEVEVPRLEEEFFVGITACEGINRFYNVTID